MSEPSVALRAARSTVGRVCPTANAPSRAADLLRRPSGTPGARPGARGTTERNASVGFYTQASRPGTSRRSQCARRLLPSDHQLLVERGLQLQQCLLVVQARPVDQEHVLGALAQRVDLRA